ncbi:MAG: DUF2268 domain-containing putative Zn-dependent protease [Candidatus Aminicenantes bacterium]
MKIHSLYRDFFKFEQKISSNSDKWRVYSTHYYKPHREFLEEYFSHFPLIDELSLKERVERIKKSDYSWLKHLVSVCPPEKIITDAYNRCKSIISLQEEPEVYLLVGFFSPDGFVMDFQNKPVIGFGLERFRDFRLLRILFAHEYAHYVLNSTSGEVPQDKKWKWLLVSEGIGTYFSRLVFPGHKLENHFLFSRATLNWCKANEAYLKEIFCSGRYSQPKLIDFYFKGSGELGLPARAGKFLGFQAVGEYVKETGDIEKLMTDKNSALSLKLEASPKP